MGQDIRFTGTAKQIQAPDLQTDEWDDFTYKGDHEIVFPDFMALRPWNYAGLDHGLLNKTGHGLFSALTVDRSFVGTSYGAWKDFREVMGKCFAKESAEHLASNSTRYQGRVPLFSIITHASAEGAMTPDAVRLLASEFRTLQTTNVRKGLTFEQLFATSVPPFDRVFFRDMYFDLRESVYATARVGGMMVFC